MSMLKPYVYQMKIITPYNNIIIGWAWWIRWKGRLWSPM